jgi:hypothetical protein
MCDKVFLGLPLVGFQGIVENCLVKVGSGGSLRAGLRHIELSEDLIRAERTIASFISG